MVRTLVSICFGRPRLEIRIKTNSITFHTVDPDLYSIFIF